MGAVSGYDDGPIPAKVWRQSIERGPRGMAYMDMLDDLTLTLWLPGDPPACDCPLDPHHRWNCPLTPIWAQTMRDLDCNPWTVVTDAVLTKQIHDHVGGDW